MKYTHLGIYAVTFPSASKFYQNVCQEYIRKVGRFHSPQLTLCMDPIERHVETYRSRNRSKWISMLESAALRLASGGADFFVCPANSHHLIFSEVRGRTAIPWLSLVEAVVERIAEEPKKLRRVGLLGTALTVESGFYSAPLNDIDVECLRLPTSLQYEVEDIIRGELMEGVVTKSGRDLILQTIEWFTMNNCDGVIIGCTEISLYDLHKDQSVPIKIFDSNSILAEKCVQLLLPQ